MDNVNDALQVAKLEVEEAKQVEKMAGSLEIHDAEDYSYAVDITQEVKSKIKEIEDQRKEWTGPLNKVIRSINAAFKPARTALEGIEKDIKGKLIAYDEAKEAERNEIYEQVEQAVAQGGDVQSLISSAAQAETPKVQGVSTRTTWTGRVVDVDRIPREYLLPDVDRLIQLTKDSHGKVEIPGWEPYEEKSIAIGKKKT